jgi:hypothetical protein
VIPLGELGLRPIAAELDDERCFPVPLQRHVHPDEVAGDADGEPVRSRVVQRGHVVSLRRFRVVQVHLPVVVDERELAPHSPGFSGVPGLPFGKSSLNRRATGSGTRSDTSPPNAAISFTPLDETKLTCGLAITYTVSTSGAR